jgi:hypothetical protein
MHLLQAVAAKVLGELYRHGLSPEDETGALSDIAERSPVLADVQADSIAGRRIVAARARASASSTCAATWRAPRWRPSVCQSWPTAASPMTCGGPGRTGRTRSCSSRWTSSCGSRRWCRRRARTC